MSGSGRGVGNMFSVSPASEDDVAGIHELMVEWEEEGITIGHEAGDEAYLSRFLAEFFFVARDSRRIVGFVCARIIHSPGYAVMPAARRVLEIDELYVRRQARRLGIGTALVEAALQQAREQGVHAFHVFSATGNTDDILRFYRRHGFEPWGIQMYLAQTEVQEARESCTESAYG